MPFSQDLHVMAAPAKAYADALGRPADGAWLAMRRPALAALLLATGTAFAATGHLTIGLLVSGLVCWCFIPLLQMVTAAAIMRSATCSLPLARRIDLWFMGHAPWSLWIFAATFTMGNARTGSRVEWPIIGTALIPIVWTSVIAAAFCRVVLGDAPAGARARTALHQAVTWTIALVYFGHAVAVWPRIVAFFGG